MTTTEAPRLAIAKERFWPSINYAPHGGQQRFHRSSARHRVAVAGRRTGKSTMAGHELTLEALLTYTRLGELRERAIRREFWIVGPEYSDSEKEFRIVWNDLERLEVPMDKPGSYNAPWAGEMDISCFDGLFQVHAKSAKYPGSLVGEGLSGVIMAEAAKLKPTIWHKFIRPTLADFRGWSIFDTTPEGKNWLYELWQRGQDPEETEWESWRFPSWVNDILFPLGRHDPEIVDMSKDMSVERFNQEIGADFTEFVGRVFKGFDEEIHVRDLSYNPEWPLYLATDHGWNNPFVALLIQTDVFDNVYVIGEYRTRMTDINDVAQALNDWRGGIVRRARMLYHDPASPGDAAVLSKKLGLQTSNSTGGELPWRLELIRQHLKLIPENAAWEDRVPRFLVDRSCNGMPLNDGGLIREMQDYRYADTKSETRESNAKPDEKPELPLKKDDHGPEALGRFFRGYYGGPEDTSGGRAVVSTARVSG